MTFTVIGAYPTGQTWVEHADAADPAAAAVAARAKMAHGAGYLPLDCQVIAVFEGELVDQYPSFDRIATIKDDHAQECAKKHTHAREIAAAIILAGFLGKTSDDPLRQIEPEVAVNGAVEFVDMLLERLQA